MSKARRPLASTLMKTPPLQCSNGVQHPRLRHLDQGHIQDQGWPEVEAWDGAGAGSGARGCGQEPKKEKGRPQGKGAAVWSGDRL